MDNYMVLKGYEYQKLNNFVDQAKHGLVSDHTLTHELKGSLSLGFWNRFKITVLSCFYSDASIAKLVADVVKPYLESLKPQASAATTLLGRSSTQAPPSSTRVAKVAHKKRSVASDSAPAHTGKRHRKKAAVLQERKGAKSAHAKRESAQLLQFGNNAKHTISFGETTVAITCEEELIGQFQSFIIPGKRGCPTATITIDNQSVKICDDPVLAKAFETAKERIEKARATVQSENGAFGQHASVVLASQVAEAARNRAGR